MYELLLCFSFFCVCVILGIKARVLCMLSDRSAVELHLQDSFLARCPLHLLAGGGLIGLYWTTWCAWR